MRHDETDEQVRRTLHDAVADVDPQRGLDDVHARSAGGRSWAGLTVVAAAMATVLALTGAVWLVQRDGSTDGATAADQVVPVLAYALVDTPVGPRLAADVRQVVSSGDPVQDALTATLTGTPSDPDYQAVVPEPGALTVTAGRGESGTVRVDVETRGAELGTDEATLTQAVAWTLAARERVEVVDVTMTIDGSPTGGPFGAQETALAPVIVESLGEGETVPTTFTVSGLAAAVEGTVAWRLLAQERVVREGFTTAEECCTPSPYSFEVEAPPGDYTLEVGETDPSDGEGFPAYVDTRRITVE